MHSFSPLSFLVNQVVSPFSLVLMTLMPVPSLAAVADFDVDDFLPGPLPVDEGGNYFDFTSTEEFIYFTVPTDNGLPSTRFWDRPSEAHGNMIFQIPRGGDSGKVSLWAEDLLVEGEVWHAPWQKPVSFSWPLLDFVPLADGSFLGVSVAYTYFLPAIYRNNFNPEEPITVALPAGTSQRPGDLRNFMAYLGIYDPNTGEAERSPAELPNVRRVMEFNQVYYIFPYGDAGNPGSYDPETNTAPNGYGADLKAFLNQSLEQNRRPQFPWNQTGNWPGEDRGSYLLVAHRILPSGDLDPAYQTVFLPLETVSNPYHVDEEGRLFVINVRVSDLDLNSFRMTEIASKYEETRGILAFDPQGRLDLDRSFLDEEDVLRFAESRFSLYPSLNDGLWLANGQGEFSRYQPGIQPGPPIAFGHKKIHQSGWPPFALQWDRSLLVAQRRSLYRFDTDGHPFPEWQIGVIGNEESDRYASLNSIHVISPNRIAVNGRFTSYNGTAAHNLVILDGKGRVVDMTRHLDENQSVAHFAGDDGIILTEDEAGNLHSLTVAELAGFRRPTPRLSVTASVPKLKVSSWPGKMYQLEKSRNSLHWEPVDTPRKESGGIVEWDLPRGATGFWRILETTSER